MRPALDDVMLADRERFRAKWQPVRVKKTRQNRSLEPRSDSIGTEKALECQPAVIVEHLVIPVGLSPAGIVVTARPLRGRGSSWECCMGDPTEFSGPTGLHDSDLDDLPVRLVFELGRVELSLGELERLAPGALVPLGRPLDEPLDIMANGRRLGRGTLVQIGDSLGVRIVSLAGHE
jgi:type III secretion protein Q